MQSSLKRFAPLALALGLGGLLVAAVIWLIQRQANVYVQSGLAVGILGLALAVLFNPEAVQTWLGGRQARYGSNVALMSVAFIGIVVLVNYLVVRNPKRWDLSEDRVNTLAPETIEAIKQLPQPVQALGFYSINFASSQSTTRDLLERYKIESAGKFNYEFHDPINEPALARQYGITRDGTLVLTMGDQKEELTFASEQELTGALIRFSHPTKRVIYFLTGHGEKDIETAGDNSLTNIADLLQKQNYEVLPLNLQVTTTIPSEARALVVAGPLVPVTQDEVNVISAYLQTQNASLIVLLDPPTGLENQTEPGTPEPLADYLRTAWGLHLSQDVIVDPTSSFPNQPFIPVSNEYGTSEITNKLQGVLTAFPLARSVLVSGTAETLPGIQWTPLVKTSAEAWGETDFASMQGAGAAPGDADAKGPLNIAVAAENTTAQSRVVVFGDSSFVGDARLGGNRVSDLGANANLFLNAVNWATLEESLINLTPKVPTTRSLVLTDAVTINLIFLITVIVMPLAVLVMGGIVWFQRRRHA